jgi:hypothetical protein
VACDPLTAEEIIRIYRMRWDIEVFFKCAKSLLRLQKEFQGRSYDLMVSHTTIVFSRYILLAWQHRQSTDQRSIGGPFYLLCDEVGTIDWTVALQQLVELINEIATKGFKVKSSNGLRVCPITSRLICRFQAAKLEIIR